MATGTHVRTLVNRFCLLALFPISIYAQQSNNGVFIRVGGIIEVRSTVHCCPAVAESTHVFLNGAKIFSGSMIAARFVDSTVLHRNYYPAGSNLHFSIVSHTIDWYSEIGGKEVAIGPFHQEPSTPLGAKLERSHVAFRFPTQYYYRNNGILTVLGVDYIRADSNSRIDLRPATGPPRQPTTMTAPFDGNFVGYFYPYDDHVENRVYGYRGSDSLLIPNELLYPDLFGQINFGPVRFGDTLSLSLISGAPGTAGERMHPELWDYGSGFWMAFFEDWYDMDFSDLFAFGYIVEPAYAITFDRPVAAPGDTVRMFVEQLFGDYAADVDFNILAGRDFAVLQDTLGNTFGKDIYQRSFAQSRQELRLVIGKTTVSGDTVVLPGRVEIQVLEDGDVYFSGWAQLRIEKPADILLGESKYYWAKEEGDKLVIEESTEPPKTSPALPATFTVEAVEPVNKPGVYWEYKYPVYAGNMFVRMADLPNGVIRLVGRYWEEEKIYKVTLTATYSRRSVEKIVEVKKPTRLGTAYGTIKDVFNQDLDLDNLVCKYAGENGIPPQIIKGHIEKETDFKPAWRYEPSTDIKYQSDNESRKRFFSSTNRFIVGEHSMGLGDKPVLHTNESPKEYNDTPSKISEFFIANWFSRYVRRGQGEKADIIIGNEKLTKLWNEKWKMLTVEKVADARDSAHKALWAMIRDTSSDIGKSFNAYAQTRIVTSYGFTQMMYTLAIDHLGRFYKETDGRYAPTGTPYMNPINAKQFPERLNEQDDLLPRYCDYLLRLLNYEFTGRIPASQWHDGFEETFRSALQKYNPGEADYGTGVLTRARKYTPSN